jgi:hypothetical protein
VFRHLTETGAIAQTEGRWEARGALEDLGIPESVRDVVGRRLSRLSDAANEALRVACVIGAEFDLAVLRTVVGGDEDTVLAAIEEAARARLVIEATGKVNRYRFGHALVRDTLYRELSASRRAAAHRRVAQAVETVHAGALDDHLPALALHWERASTPAVENDKAIDYAIRAGDRALAQLAHDEAASFYAHARELLDASRSGTDDQRRVGLLISLGEAQRRAGDPAHRDTLLEAARLAGDQGDGSALARAALANNRGVHSVAEVVDRERVAALEAALAAIGPQATPTRARLLGTLATELGFAPDHDYRFRLADEALAVARQVGDDPTLAQILSSHVISTFVPTRRAQRIEHAAELTALADRLPDPVPKFWAAFWGGIVAVEGHDIERLERQMRTALRIAAELGQPVLRWLASWSETLWCRTTGRLAQGEVVARDGYETARAAGVPDAYRSYGAILFWIRFDQGRLSELLDVLESATNRPTPSPVSQAAYALALCETDRPDVARPILERLAVNDFAALGYNAMWLYGMTMVAQVAATVDDQATARILYDQLSPFGDLVTTVGALTSGSVHHYLGCLARTLGQHDVADTHFGRATETHRQLSAPVLLTHSRLEWARMLMTRRQAGDTERARELVDQALHTARELGLRGVERHGIALKGEPW